MMSNDSPPVAKLLLWGQKLTSANTWAVSALGPGAHLLMLTQSGGLLVVRHRRSDHQEHENDQPRIRDGVLDAGRQENEIVLAHDVILARDLHQPLAFKHVIDLLLQAVLVARDMRHPLGQGKAVVDV